MRNQDKESVEKFPSYTKLHPNPKIIFSTIGLLFKPISVELGLETSYTYFIVESVFSPKIASIPSYTLVYFNQDRSFEDWPVSKILEYAVENRSYDLIYSKHMDLSNRTMYKELGYEKDLRNWPSLLLSEKYKALCKAMENDMLTAKLDINIKSLLNAPDNVRKELLIEQINWLRFMSPLDNLGDRVRPKRRS